MKYDENLYPIEKMFKNTFSEISASDEMKERLKLNVQSSIETQNEKIIGFNNWQKVVMTAACFLMIVCIANIDNIKAGVMNIYERFFSSVEQQYKESTTEYVINLNEKIKLEDDLTVEFTQVMFLNQGMDLKYRICGDTGKYDLVGCEINFMDSDKEYELVQEMYSKLSSEYLSSCVFADGFSYVTFKDYLNEKLKFNINLLYVENESDEEMSEKSFEMIITPKKIYNAKICKNSSYALYQDEYAKVNSIQINGWYIKVNYDILFEYDINEKLFGLSMNVENEELLFLSGGENEDNSYDAYYSLINKEFKEIKITPVFYSYNKSIFDFTKLNEGKTIKLNWND